MSQTTHVTQKTFEAEVLKAEVAVLADFWAEWCGPCHMIAPIVEDLAREYAGRMKVAKVDVDENPQLAIDYGIMSIPTLGLFWNGKLVDRFIGYMPAAQLKERLEAALKAHTVTAAAT